MTKAKIIKWLVILSFIALLVGVFLEFVFHKGLVIIGLSVFIFDLITIIFIIRNIDQ